MCCFLIVPGYNSLPATAKKKRMHAFSTKFKKYFWNLDFYLEDTDLGSSKLHAIEIYNQTTCLKYLVVLAYIGTEFAGGQILPPLPGRVILNPIPGHGLNEVLLHSFFYFEVELIKNTWSCHASIGCELIRHQLLGECLAPAPRPVQTKLLPAQDPVKMSQWPLGLQSYTFTLHPKRGRLRDDQWLIFGWFCLVHCSSHLFPSRSLPFWRSTLSKISWWIRLLLRIRQSVSAPASHLWLCSWSSLPFDLARSLNVLPSPFPSLLQAKRLIRHEHLYIVTHPLKQPGCLGLSSKQT